MFGRFQGRNANFPTSRLTNRGRLPNIGVMNSILSRQGVVCKILLGFLILFLGGCTFEDSNKNKLDEKNDTVEAPLPPVPPAHPPSLAWENRSPLDLNGLDRLMEENLREFGVEFSKMMPQPDRVDYERVKFLFEQSLLEKENDNPEYIYQFLCDEQEKLIYRCNKVTGEIECYSNRNDKLKILSSIK